MCASVAHAWALEMGFCRSFASLRHLPSQAGVPSTTHRRGKTWKPLVALDHLMISMVDEPDDLNAARSFGPAEARKYGTQL